MSACKTPKVPKEWQCIYDGGSDQWLWVRRTDVPSENRFRLFQFVEVTDMWGATGSDEGSRYVGEVCEVHLDELSAESIARAVESCGYGPVPEDISQEMKEQGKAEACYSYGHRAPLFSCEGNNFRKVWREAFAEARSLDARNGANILRAARLHMPVNRIGTSALSYMRGELVTDTAGVPNMASIPQGSILKWEPKP